jgi:hypothetical protein
VTYAEAAYDDAVITLQEQAYKFNYDMLSSDELIGYLNTNGFAQLRANRSLGK